MNNKLTNGLVILASVFLLAPTTAKAHPASGIVVDRAGNIYFSDLETVWKLDPQGKRSVFRQGAPGRHVHELAIDQQDNIYGADISYESQKWISDVWIMSPLGKFTYLLSPTSDPPRGMSIWRDREGNMYLVDQNNHLKQRTLLLRGSPDGTVITFAGAAYGHADGKGTEAKFGSVGGMAFGPDDSLYLTDGSSVRKVTMDGNVTTVAKDLTVRTAEDKPTLFGGSYGSLAGLAVDFESNVYVADAGNRRLLKVSRDGKVEVALRTEPPYFPNGVTAVGKDLYVLEVGFTLPNISSGPRVRKITPDGKSEILTTVGLEGIAGDLKASLAQNVGVTAESAFQILFERPTYTVVILAVGLISLIALIRQLQRRQRL